MTQQEIKQKFEGMFLSAMEEADLQTIEDVKNGVIKVERPPTKPAVPSLDGKKIRIHYKDPEAVSNAVDWFLDQMLKGVKNSHLIREELAEALYRKMGPIGEDLGIEIDLDSGKMSLTK
jgi:hypothetical protein